MPLFLFDAMKCIYESYRNSKLVHLYEYKIRESGVVSVSRTTYRISEKDKKLREIIDLSAFGTLCSSLKDARKYVKSHEKWKESADDLFNINIGKPINPGVRNEFSSENQSKSSPFKAGSDSGSGIVWGPSDFRPLRPNF